MKIKYVKIEKYRSLKKVEIRDLSDINIFHGDNNVGKSNILKALELFFSPKKNYRTMVPKKPGEEEKKILEFNFVGDVEIEDSDFYNFKKEDITFAVIIEMNERELSEIIDKNGKNTDIIIIKDDINSVRISAEISYKTNEDPETGIKNGKFALTEFVINGTDIFTETKYADLLTEMEHYLIGYYTNISCKRQIIKEIDAGGELDKINPENIQKFLYDLHLSDIVQKRNILREIKKKFNIINKDIGEITFCIKNEKPEIYWAPYSKGVQEKTVKKRNEIKLMIFQPEENIILPINNIGSGVQQSLMIIANIVANKNSSLYGIEELEANLSPTSQIVLFSNMKKMMDEKTFGISQFFITSHSSAFSNKDVENAKIYMVKNDGKETSVEETTFEKIIKFFIPYQTFFRQRINRFFKDNKIEKKDKMKDGQIATCFFDELIFNECDKKDVLSDPLEMEKIFEEIEKDVGNKYILNKSK